MSLVHVSGYNYVNPDDVSAVEGFPFNLCIVVTMKNGDKLMRFVDERDIEELMEPSTNDPTTWSRRQVDLWRSIHYPNVYQSTKVYFNNGRELHVADEEIECVNSYVPCQSRDEAFGLKLRQYASLFKIREFVRP
jgi:hypothetical protein